MVWLSIVVSNVGIGGVFAKGGEGTKSGCLFWSEEHLMRAGSKQRPVDSGK